jgi:hypothetical protein
MLKLILEMLPLLKENDSEAIAIAKGKYKIPQTINEFKQAIKWQLQRQ